MLASKVWSKLIAALLKKIFINGEMVFPSQEQNYSILKRNMLATVRLSSVNGTIAKSHLSV